MGLPVTLDSDDVEALVFAAASVKSIEGVLDLSRGDPFAKAPVKRYYTEAADRIEKAWRGATRAANNPERFSEPTEAEIAWLRRIWPPWSDDADAYLRFIQVYEQPKREGDVYRAMMVRGLIEFGTRRNAFMWGSSGETVVNTEPVTYVRITPRGSTAVLAWEREMATPKA